MNENRIIKDVVNDYRVKIERVKSKIEAKYTLIRLVYPDNSYLFMTIDYVLSNKYLNNNFYVYNHYIDTDNELTIFLEENE